MTGGDTPVPAGLRSLRRWVLWAHRDGKKPPVSAEGVSLKNWTDPRAWLSYDGAVATFAESDAVDGVGFVLGDGVGGLDLDDCRDPETGRLVPKAEGILAAFPTAYAEVSPSGKGVKVLGLADGWLEVNFRSGAAELKPAGSYFCVTGDVLPGHSDLVPLDLRAVLSALGVTRAEQEAAERPQPLPKVVPAGSQEPAMFREASRLRRLGYTVPEIAKMLWTLVEAGRFPNEAGREPWSREDCEAKARAVEKYDAEPDPYEVTDPGCAEYFRATQGEGVRYDVDRKRWLLFDDVRWNADLVERVKLNLVESLRARRRRAVGHADREKALAKVENRVPQILAAAVPYFPSRVTDYDLDPWLLGVPNGVVDLRTGELRGGRPEDAITMQARFPYDPGATCPLWEQTIAQVFAVEGQRRPEFEAYVHRALGYSATGDCREEVFFLCTGNLLSDEKNGRNGKGTLVNTVAKVLGDYADDLGFASLEWQRTGAGAGGATPDLAKLVHKRFVTASETNRGAYFNSARVKGLTGRDPITARYLYGNEFTFSPELKLWLSVNHPPRVDDDSLGFWSRPHVVEFPNTFAGKADATLKDRLLEEGRGILAWLVRGAILWQGGGLAAPREVRDAVAAYQGQQGDLPEFLEAECVVAPNATATFGELREAYVRWAQVYRKKAGGQREFAKALKKRFGEPTRRQMGPRGSVREVLEYRGLGLQAPLRGGAEGGEGRAEVTGPGQGEVFE